MLGKRSLQFGLVFCLVLGLVTGSVGSIGAQTPAPNPREAVIQQIQEQAKRDLDVGRLQRPEDVRKLFVEDAKSAGLPTAEIDKTYDEAYSKAKDAKEVDPKETVKAPTQAPIGWLIVAVATAVIALFKEWIGAIVKQVSTTVNTWIYQRFSGTKFFRNMALRKYRSALVEKHQSLKIPFRPNRPLELAGIYVPLKVAGNRTEPSVEALQVIRDCRKLMVKGQPGSGKTILLKYLALNYGLGKLRLKDDPIVILLELHRLSGGVEVLPALVEALGRDDFPNGAKFLEQALDAGRVVLLLDGLDEVNTIDRSSVVKRIKDFFDRYGKCGVVITCRSQVYQNEFDDLVDRTLEVVEFTDAQIQQFLRPWKAEMPPEKSVQQLLQSLRDRPRIKELARNPLLLTIVAYLYCDTPFVLPHSRSEFYSKSTDILLESWDQARQTANVYKGFTKRSVLQHLALFAQDGTGDRKTLSFQDVVAQVKAVLPGLNLDADRDVEPILNELVDRSGLLLRIDGGARYQFSHLTLQEFFAAGALSDRSNDLIQRVENDPDAWREVVKLWCGLANDSTAVIRQIYVSQPVMAFECLADAQNVDAALADEIIDRFQGELKQAQSGIGLEQAFAAIAADSRPRGQKMFERLVSWLEQSNCPGNRMSINALALTNLPTAAKVLALKCQNGLEIRDALIRMGDLAIPELSQLIEAGNIDALEDLQEIGTPDAAKAMVPFLWNDRPNISGEVAWYLAEILREPEIEETFHEIRLNPNQNASTQWMWIWEPFVPSKDSATLVIAARIADLILSHCRSVKISELMLSSHPPAQSPYVHSPDLRLIVPICAFSTDLTDNLPNNLPEKAEVLLSSIEKDNDLDRVSQLQQASAEILKNVPTEATCYKLLTYQSQQFQLHFLSSLIAGRKVQQKDWLNLFRRVTYDFQNGWHYRLVLSVAVMTSIVALVEMFYLPFQERDKWTSWLFGLPILILVNNWQFLWQGIENQLESDLFLKFGVLGAIAFWREIIRLFKYKITWSGIEKFLDVFDQDRHPFAYAFACLGSFLFSYVGVGILKVPDALVVTSTVVGIIALAVLSSFMGAALVSFRGSFKFILLFTVVSIVALASALNLPSKFTIEFTIQVAVIGGAAVWIAVVGIVFWLRARSNPDFKRYFAIFSYPFFCAFPIVLIYSSLGIHNFFPWQTVALIWFTIITVCTLLWQRGQHLDKAARNPFQKILEGYYEGPIPLAPLKRGNRK